MSTPDLSHPVRRGPRKSLERRRRERRARTTMRLKVAVARKGISRAELTKVSGLAPGLIGKYLDGEIAIGPENADVLAPLLDVEPAWLAGFGADDIAPRASCASTSTEAGGEAA